MFNGVGFWYKFVNLLFRIVYFCHNCYKNHQFTYIYYTKQALLYYICKYKCVIYADKIIVSNFCVEKKGKILHKNVNSYFLPGTCSNKARRASNIYRSALGWPENRLGRENNYHWNFAQREENQGLLEVSTNNLRIINAYGWAHIFFKIKTNFKST